MLDTGITYRLILEGYVPELEEREAARLNGYTWREWQQLAYDEKVDGIAVTRVQHFIDMHRRDAQDREATRQARRAQARKRR